MTITLGEKIISARKRRGMSQEHLGEKINVSKSTIWKIENGDLQDGPTPNQVNQIAEALEDNEIRLVYLETNPVFKAVIPRIFPELNRIRTDPSIVFSRFADEAEEAARSARVLSQMFAHANPRSLPDFKEKFEYHMDQIVDVERCAEIVMTSLVAAQVMTEAERRGLYVRQQDKCEKKGHHNPAKTGTEG
jgi:transcriptional regulator with XRE-family HTH domain